MSTFPTFEEWKKNKAESEEKKYRVYEDSFRAFKAGDKEAAFSALRNTPYSDADYRGWQTWHTKNAPRLDVEYAFKAYDPSLVDAVGKKYKATWGDATYYSVDDPEDYQRMLGGQMPKFLEKKYKLDDPFDRYLYDQGLPWRSEFSDLYSEAYKKANEITAGMVDADKTYKTSYDSLLDELSEALTTQRKNVQAGGEAGDPYDIIEAILTSGRYDDLAGYYREPQKEDDDADPIAAHFKALMAPDFSLYDEAYAAIQRGESPSGEFWNNFKENDYKKWLANRNAFSTESLLRAASGAPEDADIDALTQILTGSATAKEIEEDPALWNLYAAMFGLETEDDAEDSAAGYDPAAAPESKAVQDAAEQLQRLTEEALASGEVGRHSGKDIKPQNWKNRNKAIFRAVNNLGIEATRDPGSRRVADLLDSVGESIRSSQYLLGGEHDATFDPGYAARYMTDEERAIYNLYAAQGENAAQKYFDALRPTLNSRGSAEEQELVDRLVSSNPAVASIAGTVMQPAAAVEGYVTQLGGVFGNEVYENDPRLQTARMTSAARAGVSADMTPAQSFFYNSGMSIMDNLARLPMGKLGLPMMGGAVAAGKADESLRTGATSKQALMAGAAAGLIEIVTEYVSLDRLLSTKAAGSAKGIVLNILKQSGVEASEEMASEVLNLIADSAIRLDDSEWKEKIAGFQAEGYSPEKARLKALSDCAVQTLLAGVGGALSGMFFGAGGQVVTTYQAGRASGGNVVNSFGVGNKALRAYEQAVKDGKTLGSGVQLQIAQDINALALNREDADAILYVADQFSRQPESWVTPATAQLYAAFSKTLGDNAARAHTWTAQREAQATKARTRLTTLYTRMQEAYDLTDAALQAGDLAAHARALETVNAAMRAYQDAYTNAEADATAQDAAHEQKMKGAQEAVVTAAAKLEAAIPGEVEYQQQLAANIENAKTLEELRDALMEKEIADMELRDIEDDDPIDWELFGLGETELLDRAADAMARGDVQMYQEIQDYLDGTVNHRTNPLSDIGPGSDAYTKDSRERVASETPAAAAQIAPNMSNAAEATVVPPVGASAPAASQPAAPRSALDYFFDPNGELTDAPAVDMMDEILNGGNQDGERGRDQALDAERVRGNVQGSAGGGEYAGARGTGPAEHGEMGEARGAARTGGTVAVDEKTFRSDVERAVAKYNREYRAAISPDFFRQIGDAAISPAMQKLVRMVRSLTGQGITFYESDGKEGFFGFTDTRTGMQYVRYTGTVEDVFHIAHENAHNLPKMLSFILNAKQSAQSKANELTIPSRALSAYQASRNARTGALESVRDMEIEFACDVVGAFVYEQMGGTNDVWGGLGFNPEDADTMRKIVEASFSSEQINELDREEIQSAYQANADAADVVFSGYRIKDQIHDYQNELNGMLPVADIDSVGMMGRGKKTLLSELLETFGENGLILDRKGYGLVVFGKNQIKNGLAHVNTDAEYAAFQAVPHVLKRGRVIGENNNHGGVKQKTITFGAPVIINGVRGSMGVTVIEEKKNYYHAHRILMPDGTAFEFHKIENAGLTTSVDHSSYDGNKTPISPAFANSIRHSTDKSNWEVEKLSSSNPFTGDGAKEGQPRQGTVLKKALDLFENNVTPIEYFRMSQEDGGEFDLNVARQLRGIMLRNGIDVGGMLGKDKLNAIEDIMAQADHKHALGLTLSAPVRAFENVFNSRWKNGEAKGDAIKRGNLLKNTYYEYGNCLAAAKDAWMMEKQRPIYEAFKNNGPAGDYESAIIHMLGQRYIFEAEAAAAVSDGKHFIVQAGDGVFVFDKHGQLVATSDGYTVTEYTKEFRDRLRDAKSVKELVKVKPITRDGALTVKRSGNAVTVYRGNGSIVAEVVNGVAPNMKAVNATCEAMLAFYNEVYDAIAEALVNNGYAAPGFIQDYMPHIMRMEGGVTAFIESLMNNELPTEINGMTRIFTPGTPWNANLEARLGTYTEFDAIRAFNRYLSNAGATIFYTPMIQRCRQLEKALRQQGAGALFPEDKVRNSAFVDWLHEYGNQWANKKADSDRSLESLAGREMYSVSDKAVMGFSMAAVGLSASSTMSNYISHLTGMAQVEPKYALAETGRTLAQLIGQARGGEYDGFADKIPFMVRRFSKYEDILTNKLSKIKRGGTKVLYAAFTAVDRFAVESCARAKYAELQASGMAEGDIIRAVDDFLIKNFADRGTGQASRISNVKWAKPFIQFQLEVDNMLHHFRDMDRATAEAKLAALEKKYGEDIPWDDLGKRALSSGGLGALKKKISYLIYLSLYGLLARWLTGRDQTWSPLGMAADFVGDAKEGGLREGVRGIGENAINNLPYASMAVGGGRIPLASGLTSIADVLTMLFNDESDDISTRDWIKAGTSFMPGGGQIRKSVTGIMASAKGGEHTDDGRLRYPIEEDDFWKTMLFGPSAAAPRGYDWTDKPLSKERTESYQELTGMGYDPMEVFYMLAGYNGSTNATKALSILTADADGDGTPDFTGKDVDVIAEVLGLSYEPKAGKTLKDWAEYYTEDYRKKTDKLLEDGKELGETRQKNQAAIDEFWEIMAGMH